MANGGGVGVIKKMAVKDLTDDEIFAELSSIGIETGIDEFKAEAVEAGSPSVLAKAWEDVSEAKDEKEDFLYEAALELWKRHLGHIRCPEFLAGFIDETVKMYEENPDEHDRFSLLKMYERIREFYDYLIKEDGSPDIDIYNDLTWHTHYDFEVFLLTIPFEFARHKLVDEAINIGRWFADISSQPANFLRDAGCILAEAGREAEAIRQIEENLKRFPNDIWVVINAGDAMWSLGKTGQAEDFFLKAYKMAAKEYDKPGVLERLMDLYKETGMIEKAKVCEKEYKELMTPPRYLVKKKKTDRNNQ